jgi:hypothetical protein
MLEVAGRSSTLITPVASYLRLYTIAERVAVGIVKFLGKI